MGRRWGRASAVVIVGVVTILFASGCVFDGTWTVVAPPVVDRPSHRLTAVDCPTSDVCVATGSMRFLTPTSQQNPFVAVRVHGVWTRHDIISPYKTYLDVTCSGPDRCLMAWEQWYPDDPVADTGIDAWDGDSISPVTINDSAAGSCVPGGPCRVIRPDATWTWTGTTLVPWSTGPSARVDVVSCPTDGFCLGAAWGTGAVVRFDADGGHPVPLPAGMTGGMTWPDLDCASATSCQIIGVRTSPGDGQAYLSWDGASLVERDGPSPAAAGVWSISCSKANACVALSGSSTIAFVGGTWFAAPASPPGLHPAALSCPAGATTCLVVGATAAVGASTSAAATYDWTDT